MSDSYTESSTVGRDLIRLVFSTLDRPVYGLLTIVYELFFNVASADLFSNNTIMKFYGRVQVILGVFMMFQLAMTFLRGIVEPDSFSKDKGGGSFLRRVATALILITVLMPISIGSPRNEYEKQINNNGLLFGTLYSLQHRILSNNTLGRLVLGTSDTNTTFMGEDEDEELQKSARIFASTVLKGFYRINLVPEDQRVDSGTKDPATINENRMCKDIDDGVLSAYTRLDADPGEIIGMVNETCTVDINPLNIIPVVNAFAGTKKYIFNYTVLLPTVVGIIFIFVLLSFTVDVAVRAVKLAVLRLLAPIPILAYMDPKGSRDEAFKSWTKTLTSTYLDLFIRLAVVYFVIFLIQDMIVNGVVINHGSGVLGIFSLIIIWIGLFIFAKQAPKFIKQVLGLKDDPGKLFGGFGELGAALGMAAAVPGAIGSGIASARASRMADETRKSLGQNVNPDGIFNRGKHLIAGISGGFMGGAAGVRAAATAKDHAFQASMDAMHKRNAGALTRGDAGSTLGGRILSGGRQIFTGEGMSDAIERDISSNKSRIDALKSIKDRVSGEMVKQDWTYGRLDGHDSAGNIFTDANGHESLFNYKTFVSQLEAAQAANKEQFEITDSTGQSHTIRMEEALHQKGFLLKNNEDDYIQRAVQGGRDSLAVKDSQGREVTYTFSPDQVSKEDSRLVTLVRTAQNLGGSSDFTRDASGHITKGDNKPITNRSSINDAIDGFTDLNAQLSQQNSVNKANDQYSSGKK